MSATSYLADVGADIEYLWPQRYDDAGFLIGVRAGYTLPLAEGIWDLDDGVINDLDGDFHRYPKISPGGFYAWVVVGAGWGD